MNWQYKIIQIIPGRTAEIVNTLNALGASGWEAIHFTNTSVILKRAGVARSETLQGECLSALSEEINARGSRVVPRL